MIDDSHGVQNQGNIHNDLPIDVEHNNPPPGIDRNAPPAPLQEGGEVKKSLNLEPSKIAKGILKAVNKHRVTIISGLGLGAMALGAGLMISFAFVPSVGIGLIIGGALLAGAGATVAVLAPLLDPVVDKGIEKVVEGSKALMDAIRDNPKLAEIRDKFNDYASSCCGKLDTAVEDFLDRIKREVNNARA